MKKAIALLLLTCILFSCSSTAFAVTNTTVKDLESLLQKYDQCKDFTFSSNSNDNTKFFGAPQISMFGKWEIEGITTSEDTIESLTVKFNTTSINSFDSFSFDKFAENVKYYTSIPMNEVIDVINFLAYAEIIDLLSGDKIDDDYSDLEIIFKSASSKQDYKGWTYSMELEEAKDGSYNTIIITAIKKTNDADVSSPKASTAEDMPIFYKADTTKELYNDTSFNPTGDLSIDGVSLGGHLLRDLRKENAAFESKYRNITDAYLMEINFSKDNSTYAFIFLTDSAHLILTYTPPSDSATYVEGPAISAEELQPLLDSIDSYWEFDKNDVLVWNFFY